VMEIITRAKNERAGVETDENSLAQMSEMIRTSLDDQSQPLFATARLWDDGIIDPRDTRAVLIETLSICADGDARALKPNTFGVARL